MLHKTQKFAPFDPNVDDVRKMNKDNLPYVSSVPSCSAFLWHFESLEADTPDRLIAEHDAKNVQ